MVCDDGRLLEITYGSGGAYVDACLTAPKKWRDVYLYDQSGNPAGWRRHVDGEWMVFTADGKRVLARDSAGEPLRDEPVRYALDDKTGRLEMVAE